MEVGLGLVGELLGGAGDVVLGRIARTVVADGFEAKDESKGTDKNVRQAPTRGG